MFLHDSGITTTSVFDPHPHRDELVVLNAIRYHSLRHGGGVYREHLQEVRRKLAGEIESPFNRAAPASDQKGYEYMTRFVESSRLEELERELGFDPAAEREFEDEVAGIWFLQKFDGDSLWVPGLLPDYRERIELYFALVANAYDPYLTLDGRSASIEVFIGALASSERAWADDPLWPRSGCVRTPPPSLLARCRERRVKRMIERAGELRNNPPYGYMVSGAEVIRSMRSPRAHRAAR